MIGMAPYEPAPQALESSRDARMLQALDRALHELPFYARTRALAVERTSLASSRNASLDERVSALPLLTRRELRSALPKAWMPAGFDLRAALAGGELETAETAGTTGERLRILRRCGESESERRRALLQNPVARVVMEDAAYREARLTRPLSGMRTCHAGALSYEERCAGATVFLNQRPDPMFWAPEDMDRMLAEMERHGARGLEADATHLARLARHAKDRGASMSLAFVVLTNELATAPALRALMAVTDAPVLRALGSVEAGPLLVERAPGELVTAVDDLYLEVLPAKVPTPGAEGVGVLVSTSLGARAQPLLRYVTNDLVGGARGAARGRLSARSLEGRVEDALVRPDGALVTSGAVDRALEALDLVAYQLVQTTPERVEVMVKAGGVSSPEAQLRAVEDALAPLLAGLTLELRTVAAVAPEGSGRFRSTKRLFPKDLGELFALPGASS